MFIIRIKAKVIEETQRIMKWIPVSQVIGTRQGMRERNQDQEKSLRVKEKEKEREKGRNKENDRDKNRDKDKEKNKEGHVKNKEDTTLKTANTNKSSDTRIGKKYLEKATDKRIEINNGTDKVGTAGNLNTGIRDLM